jgi:hypothetical protein
MELWETTMRLEIDAIVYASCQWSSFVIPLFPTSQRITVKGQYKKYSIVDHNITTCGDRGRECIIAVQRESLRDQRQHPSLSVVRPDLDATSSRGD